MDEIFSTAISEHAGHLFEVGLLRHHHGLEQRWVVEVRLIDANGHPVEPGATVLDAQFADKDVAKAAGAAAARQLIKERLKVAD
jgi:hypothetical protein